MVHITPETVDKFRRVFKKEYGVEYSDRETWEAAYNFLGFFDLLLKVDQRQHPENYLSERTREESNGVK